MFVLNDIFVPVNIWIQRTPEKNGGVVHGGSSPVSDQVSFLVLAANVLVFFTFVTSSNVVITLLLF
jgi:hypothetical protein